MAAESKKLPIIEGFTPGPWRLCPKSEPQRRPRYYIEAGAGGPYICEVEIRAHNPATSNSHLIAAAPDLYRIAHEQREVIRALVTCLENPGDPELPTIQEVLDQAAPFLEA